MSDTDALTLELQQALDEVVGDGSHADHVRKKKSKKRAREQQGAGEQQDMKKKKKKKSHLVADGVSAVPEEISAQVKTVADNTSKETTKQRKKDKGKQRAEPIPQDVQVDAPVSSLQQPTPGDAEFLSAVLAAASVTSHMGSTLR